MNEKEEKSQNHKDVGVVQEAHQGAADTREERKQAVNKSSLKR